MTTLSNTQTTSTKNVRTRAHWAAGLAGATLLLSGCLSPAMSGGSSAPATVIDSFPICPGEQRRPYVELMTNSGDLSAFYQRAAMMDDSLSALPQVNFSSASVILVGYGQKPSSGYQLNFLNSNRATKSGDDLEMTITTAAPNSTDVVATVMTNPCVLVETQKVPENTKVRVYDQNQRFFARN